MLKNKSVLILENNLINIECMTVLLNSYGMQPKLTRKESITLTALQKTKENSNLFDAIILNESLISSTLMNEVSLYLQEHDIPIVFISAKPELNDLKTRYQLKNCNVISMPIKEKEFYMTLLSVFGDNSSFVEQSDDSKLEIKNIAHASEVHVLVVDDNLISQQVSVKILEKMGFLVHGANNGVEALEAIAVIPFDIIFMDCQMPEMDGFEATRRLRKDPSKNDVPVIALTANALSSDKEACLAAGMNDFISKPVTSESLAAIMQKYMPKVLENRKRA